MHLSKPTKQTTAEDFLSNVIKNFQMKLVTLFLQIFIFSCFLTIFMLLIFLHNHLFFFGVSTQEVLKPLTNTCKKKEAYGVGYIQKKYNI
jgi:hypothetical protein